MLLFHSCKTFTVWGKEKKEETTKVKRYEKSEHHNSILSNVLNVFDILPHLVFCQIREEGGILWAPQDCLHKVWQSRERITGFSVFIYENAIYRVVMLKILLQGNDFNYLREWADQILKRSYRAQVVQGGVYTCMTALSLLQPSSTESLSCRLDSGPRRFSIAHNPEATTIWQPRTPQTCSAEKRWQRRKRQYVPVTESRFSLRNEWWRRRVWHSRKYTEN